MTSRPRAQQDHLRVIAGTNECGVPAYVTRSHASRAESLIPRDGKRCRPYRCDHCNLFHIGHLPGLVVSGVVTAAEWYGRGGNPPYGEIVKSCVALARRAGAVTVDITRGPGETWVFSATAYGRDLTAAGHGDPVAATEALIELIGTALGERQAELEEACAATGSRTSAEPTN